MNFFTFKKGYLRYKEHLKLTKNTMLGKFLSCNVRFPPLCHTWCARLKWSEVLIILNHLVDTENYENWLMATELRADSLIIMLEVKRWKLFSISWTLHWVELGAVLDPREAGTQVVDQAQGHFFGGVHFPYCRTFSPFLLTTHDD